MRPALVRNGEGRHPVVMLLLFVAVVIVSAGALAPVLWAAGKAFAAMVESRGWREMPVVGWFGGKLAESDFGRYFGRAFLVSALGWLWPFLRWMGVGREGMGLEPNPRRWVDYAGGFVVASGMLLAMGGYFVWRGAYDWRIDPKLSGKIGRVLMSAAVVPVLEEFLFRGVFLGMAMRAARRGVAMVVVSGLFAVLHLIKPPDPLPESLANEPIRWWSGFEMTGIIFRS